MISFELIIAYLFFSESNQMISSFLVRRNETVCCLIGFGIGVGCCILYRLISNFLTPSINIIPRQNVNNPHVYRMLEFSDVVVIFRSKRRCHRLQSANANVR